jgi:transketolase
VVPGLDGAFELGRAQIIKEGQDLLLIAMGGIANEVAAAAQMLEDDGFKCEVMVVASINPAPVDDLQRELSKFRQAITVEAHYAAGGLCSLVSEVVAQSGISCRITRCAVENSPDGETGGQAFLYNKFGISAKAITARAKALLCGVVA